MTISAAFLALALAMTLLGPAPAAVLGVMTTLAPDLRRRRVWRHMLVDVSTYAFFPLVGGVPSSSSAARRCWTPTRPSTSCWSSRCSSAMNILNFALIALDVAVVEGQSVIDGFRDRVLLGRAGRVRQRPADRRHRLRLPGPEPRAVALVAVIGLVFQYLLRTALNSMDRKDELEGRTRELASLQVGLLGTVLQTLSLRDKMTARHSAAVARYSREIASELGLSEREQDVVHTAALLHDIGKFIFPDSILFASTRLSQEDLEIVRRHPEQGARLVARMDGYGPVAEIVLAHHERIDGCGYPNGLAGEQIPLAARIIAVADTYDVMTARDSYRRPVSSREAIAELRRVSGSQLDEAVVDTFIGLLEKRSVTFRHADDADFERELNLDRRIRDYAAPRVAAA